MRRCQPGFNLLEITLSIGLILVLADISFSIGNYFYQKNCLDNSISQLKSAIALTKNRAKGQENDDVWGILAEKNNLVIFQGSSYSESDPNNYSEKFYCGTDVKPSPEGPLFFNKQSGFPQGEKIFYFANGKLLSSLFINNYGIISQ